MSELFGPAPRPVLVVEDSEEDFDTVLEAARRCGVQNRIVWAPDADAARRLFPPGGVAAEPFAFVLLDQNLPGTPGSELLLELRREPSYRTLPVVMFTTSTSPRDRAACYSAGANAYHVKSVRFDQCLQTLAEVFYYWLRSAVLPDP